MNEYPAVLYIEDDPLSRKIMEMLLCHDLDLAHVTMFADSTEFSARVQALVPKPDVIFLDVHIRPHTGFEILAALRTLEAFQRVPIVALTASVMNEEIQQLQNVGFSGCLAKPIDVENFATLFQQILNGESIWRIN